MTIDEDFRRIALRIESLRNDLMGQVAGKVVGIQVDTQVYESKMQLALAVAANYMKPGTGTTDPTQAADVEADARYFDKALRAAWAVVNTFINEP
jgi:hypothetical protein